MTWVKPKYRKSEVDRAGGVLTSETSTEEQKDQALEILDNWRAIHSYPMHVFKIRLKRTAKSIDKDALTAQRLKRVPAILKKLNRSYDGRPPTMKLSQMQDIGGCRAVLSNVIMARKLYQEYYLKGDIKHKRVGVKDYIAYPKKDGYRSIHVIYRYSSDKGKQDYNGLLVEIQIRSKLQHLWATAIEIVDFFTRQAIKTNEGQEEWMEFFKLVSSAFAMIESCPCVPDTPEDEKELYFKIMEKEKELNVIKKMNGWTHGFKVFQQASKEGIKAQFFLLDLDILGGNLRVTAYPKKSEQRAIKDYARLEKKYQGRKEFDVVLVGADTKSELENLYPNYFVDCNEFLHHLEKIVNKYDKSKLNHYY